MEYSTIVLQIICLALIVKSGESTKCYLCNSATNPQCGDQFNSDNSLQPVECTPESIKMVADAVDSIKDKLKEYGFDSVLKNLGLDTKTVDTTDLTKAVCQKVNIQVKDKTTVVRSCALPKTTTDTCAQFEKAYEGSKDAKLTFCDYCDKDGCNAASGVTPGTLLVSLLAALCLTAIFKAY